jgi:HSP20 family protein
MAEWTPWQNLETLRREINRVFEDSSMFNEPFARTAFLPGRSARRYPLVNIREDRDAVYIEALSPGVDSGSLDITVLRNVLTITGEKRRVPSDVQPEAFHRSERATGKFVRSIEMPVEIDEDKVQADYQRGLLLIRLPKAEKAKPKQISVQVG